MVSWTTAVVRTLYLMSPPSIRAILGSLNSLPKEATEAASRPGQASLIRN